ncbi:MAG: hypothetical protein EOO93_29500 [Pedobacter sp.]|nr:MAG: hypothetical protein EOO93_29500 [Pedobacter sp.]
MRFAKRSKLLLLFLLAPLASYFLVSHNWKNQSRNQFVNELSGNGMYDFGFAFWHNQLDYNTFYKTISLKKAIKIISKNLSFEPINLNGYSTLRNIKAELNKNTVAS